jgi:hypothetical protein
MNTARRMLMSLAIVACVLQATNISGNNNRFRPAETSWSRWISIAGSRAGGVDYSRKDEKGLSCVRFRNRYSYPVHIDCVVKVKKDGQPHTQRVGWLLQRGESGQDLANDCFQGDAIISVKVTRTVKG